ncbi:hypothetical protein SBOR_1847 [Sclerotinia borealis F-4128]|uniref:Zona occludens toxin N-terminal domain-containing protein n=1 Tax=Sclerotinia borealis (strain F-4128) TaxID=1432307 RepID=W9CTD5_SCLBF|nr:hypothetical protein SBOR_1847 [Sclerotinia borealis F-4128]
MNNINTNNVQMQNAEYALHLNLLNSDTGSENGNQQATTPIFTTPLCNEIGQYGLIAGQSSILANENGKQDPRLFYNIAAPFSSFICGSQGSGKSHTLSCFLENCLAKSVVSKVKNPLSALLFHYDGFIGDIKGTPCEAAYLASNPDIKVRVLCSPTNFKTIQRTYGGMNVKISQLCIDQTDLTTQRMFDLMAVNPKEELPLYLHSIGRVLRVLRMAHQISGRPFHYGEFKKHIEALKLTTSQEGPLSQRLDTLESFMPLAQRGSGSPFPVKRGSGTDWRIKVLKPPYRELTIVDLSCPCVTAEAASSLFNICLSLFLEEKSKIGKVVALDEAHKYMSASTGDPLTNNLLSTIRLQRHLGTRVFISTQEPTISPALIDLCSMTIVHRFSSPEWLRVLRQHVAALYNSGSNPEDDYLVKGNVFKEIVRLQVGEALLFAPEAVIGTGSDHHHSSRLLHGDIPIESTAGLYVERESGDSVTRKRNGKDIETDDDIDGQALRKLGTDYIKMKVRGRLTNDGGRSVLAA